MLGYGGAAQTNDHIAGPLIASCAIIAWWQVTRGLRWINVLLGLWLLAAPWVLGYGASLAGMNSMITGALLAGLSFIKGKSEKPFGGGQRFNHPSEGRTPHLPVSRQGLHLDPARV